MKLSKCSLQQSNVALDCLQPYQMNVANDVRFGSRYEQVVFFKNIPPAKSFRWLATGYGYTSCWNSDIKSWVIVLHSPTVIGFVKQLLRRGHERQFSINRY